MRRAEYKGNHWCRSYDFGQSSDVIRSSFTEYIELVSKNRDISSPQIFLYPDFFVRIYEQQLAIRASFADLIPSESQVQSSVYHIVKCSQGVPVLPRDLVTGHTSSLGKRPPL